MGENVATMIEWFHDLNQRDHAAEDLDLDRYARWAASETREADWRAWWALLDDLTPADHAMLSQWYDALHAS